MLLSLPVQAEAPNCNAVFAKISLESKADSRVAVDQPEVLELQTRNVSQDVLKAVRDKNANFSYVVDEQGHIYAEEGPLRFTDSKLQVAIVRDSSGNQAMAPLKESGIITYLPKEKNSPLYLNTL